MKFFLLQNVGFAIHLQQKTFVLLQNVMFCNIVNSVLLQNVWFCYTFAPKEKNEKTWPFDQPFFVILNLAIGGNFGGPEVDDSIFPKEFIIDYIKVSKN